MDDGVVRFWVDGFGYVWVGPCDDGDCFRYARFEGLFVGGSGKPTTYGNWVWRQHDHDPDWEELTVERFQAFLRLHGCSDYGAMPVPGEV